MMTKKTLYRLLPPLSTDEKAALKASIKEFGVRTPIVEDENGNILDGHHRYEIDKNAKRKTLRGLTEAEKQAYVFEANFSRRNLSAAQRKAATEAMKQVAKALKSEGRTQKEIGARLGVSQQWVAKWLMPNTTRGNTHTDPTTDCRVKLGPDAKADIGKRVDAGEDQAQVAADYHVDQSTVSRVASAETKEKEKKKTRAKAAKEAGKMKGKTNGVRIGDFRKVLSDVKDGSVSLVFADPPYDRKSVDLYADLGAFAARTLAPGGSLLCYCGHYLVPDVIERLTPHLRYWWLCGVQHEGGKCARMREYGIVVRWKPILWFVKDTRGDKDVFVDDLVASPAPEKDHHEWQQSVVEAKYYIEALTMKGELVVDPFCGGGTTALAAKQSGRTWLTCDVDKEAALISRRRLA